MAGAPLVLVEQIPLHEIRGGMGVIPRGGGRPSRLHGTKHPRMVVNYAVRRFGWLSSKIVSHEISQRGPFDICRNDDPHPRVSAISPFLCKCPHRPICSQDPMLSVATSNCALIQTEFEINPNPALPFATKRPVVSLNHRRASCTFRIDRNFHW